PVRVPADDPPPPPPPISRSDDTPDAIVPAGVLAAGIDVAPPVAGPVAGGSAPVRAHLPLTSGAVAASHAGAPVTVSLGPVAPGLPATAQVSRLTAVNRNATTMSG